MALSRASKYNPIELKFWLYTIYSMKNKKKSKKEEIDLYHCLILDGNMTLKYIH